MKIPFLLCLVVMATGWICCAGRVCERITVPLCTSGIGYNYTSMPNIMNHTSQDEAALEFHQFYPLVKVGCSSSLQKFLCSAYIPRCTQTGGVMSPCRSLCEEARRGCQPLMNKFGFPWPASLNCSTFPVEGGDISYIAPDAPRGRICERITVPLCTSGIGYNYTSMPNILNHTSQDEAGLEIHQFYPLVKVGCSSSLQKFLCSVYTPRCTRTGGVMPPCRSLCEEARRGCQPLMKKLGFPWPASLNCSPFPVEGGDISCIAPDAPRDTLSPTPTPTPKITTQPTTEISSPTPPRRRVCERITIPMCKDMGYNYTSMPNIFNHDSQNEAALEIHQYWPLVEIGCSIHLRFLLCSAYAPMCKEDAETFLPCRSVCEKSKRDCEALMKRFGFTWSAGLNCLRFPVQGGQKLCLAPANQHAANTTARPKENKTMLVTASGVFTSPNYPNPYPQGVKQDWIIQLPDWCKMIRITIEKMRLEEDRNCLYDYIIIKDKILNQVGPRHCGTYRYPHQVPVRGNKAIITFVSDGSTSKAGFLIKYKGLNSVPSEEADISSPK